MGFLKTYFSEHQLILLLAFFVFLLLMASFHALNRKKVSIVFMIISALCVFFFASSLDPFLNTWDERFHALVAKNLMNDFLKPTLYPQDHIIDFGYISWASNYIWLHKQPMFLWQIALSFKLFGPSIFTLRLPDVLLGCIMVFGNYRCGKLMVGERAGILTAILTFSTPFFIKLISGRQMTDHNDFIFLVYISLSIWSFIEYYYSNKKYWLIAIGLFSGFAILTKWLVGLLIFLPWGLLKIQRREFKLSAWKDILLSSTIAVLVALPWQLFILFRYNLIAKEEFALNAIHFSEVVEGHGGDFFYHVENVSNIYGVFVPFLLLLGFYLWYIKNKDKKLLRSVFITIVFVYLFFSIAATKMPAFTIVVSTFILLTMAHLWESVLNLLKSRKLQNIIFILSVLVIVLLRLDVENLQRYHTLWKKENIYSRNLMHNTELFQSLKLPKNAVIFNAGNHYIEAMFHTDCIAYWMMPTEEQCKQLLEHNKKIVILGVDENNPIPAYLNESSDILKLKQRVHDYDKKY